MIGSVLEHTILSSTFYAGMHAPTSGRLLPLQSLVSSHISNPHHSTLSPKVGSDALAAFLSAHVDLEVLNLDISRTMDGESRLAIPHNSLPCLRSMLFLNADVISLGH
jgi:hypothetical protein